MFQRNYDAVKEARLTVLYILFRRRSSKMFFIQFLPDAFIPPSMIPKIRYCPKTIKENKDCVKSLTIKKLKYAYNEKTKKYLILIATKKANLF